VIPKRASLHCAVRRRRASILQARELCFDERFRSKRRANLSILVFP
jgi:hypothetical protein